MEDGVWFVTWLMILIVLLCLPFLTNRHRRQLCWRRIKECQWIEDEEGADDWYDIVIQRYRERRRQLDEEQRIFKTTKTQDDEVREKFLKHLAENYTMQLTNSDMDGVDNRNTSGQFDSKRSLGNLNRQCSTQQAVNDGGEQCQSTVVDEDDVDLEGRDTSDVLVYDFDDCHQKVSVPLAGQTKDTHDEETSTGGRLVPSGCAICLGEFSAGDNITWSSNSQCLHVFHTECVLHWFLVVGRKEQDRRRRRNPNMSAEEDREKICKFSLACPCCRQVFYVNTVEEGGTTNIAPATSDSDVENRARDSVLDDVVRSEERVMSSTI